MKFSALYLISIITAVCCSCINIKQLPQQTRDTISYCGPSNGVEYAKHSNFIDQEVLFKDTILLKKYSKKDLLLANAAGVYRLLKSLDSLEKDSSVQELERLSIKQDLNTKLVLFLTQISSVVSELDCEAERATQMGNYISDIDEKKTMLRTIESIVVGSITGILTTAVSEDRKVEYAVAISGGVLTASLGISALFTEKKTQYNHSRNMLEDIWFEKNEHSHYPSSVWYVLNERLFSNSQEYDLIHNIRERWIHYGYVDENSEKEINLFFGKGGKYSGNQLKTRANMLNQLQSSVREINQDFERLVAKMVIK